MAGRSLIPLLTSKEIQKILHVIGSTGVTNEQIDNPTGEAVQGWFQRLAETAYDMELTNLKTQLPLDPPEIYGEAVDVVTVFKFAKQMAQINGIEDFSWKDIWDPQPRPSKRLRLILSGLINFCRFKEKQSDDVASMSGEMQALNVQRFAAADALHAGTEELAAARARHAEELPTVIVAENAKQEAQTGVDHLQKQMQNAERVAEAAEAKRESEKARAETRMQHMVELRAQQAELNGLIAESPEGLERDKMDLHTQISEKRAFIEGRISEKRSRQQRDQVLARILISLDSLDEANAKTLGAKTQVDAARERAKAEEDALADFQRGLYAQAEECAELEELIKQVQEDIVRGEREVSDREQELDARRQRALQRHVEMQAKRTEEQKALNALLHEKSELEAEFSQERHKLQAECAEIQRERFALKHDHDDYIQDVGAPLNSKRNSDAHVIAVQSLRHAIVASPSPARGALRSPGAALKSCLKSPARQPVI